MKHYQTKPIVTAPPAPAAVPMRRLLEDRKIVLEAQVRSRLRAAREDILSGAADVKALSAALRSVKAKIAALPKPTPGESDAR